MSRLTEYIESVFQQPPPPPSRFVGEDSGGGGATATRVVQGQDKKWYVVNASGQVLSGPYETQSQASSGMAPESLPGGPEQPSIFNEAGLDKLARAVNPQGTANVPPQDVTYGKPTTINGRRVQEATNSKGEVVGYKDLATGEYIPVGGTDSSGAVVIGGEGAGGGYSGPTYGYMADGRAYTVDPVTGQRKWAPEADLDMRTQAQRSLQSAVEGSNDLQRRLAAEPDLAKHLAEDPRAAESYVRNPARFKVLSRPSENFSGSFMFTEGGTKGDSLDASVGITRNDLAQQMLGRPFDMLTGEDLQNVERAYQQKAAEQGAQQAQQGAAVDSLNAEIARSSQQQAQQAQDAANFYQQRRRRPIGMNTGGSVTGGVMDSVLYGDEAKPIFLNNDPTGQMPEDMSGLNLSAQLMNQQNPGTGWAAYTSTNGQRRFYGGHWYRLYNGEWVLDDPEGYRATDANGQPWQGREEAVRPQMGVMNQVLSMDAYDPPTRPQRPVQPPPQGPAPHQPREERPPPVLMNQGGQVGAGVMDQVLYGQNSMGQPSIQTPEEMAVVGLETGHVYSVLGEGPDGIGGVKQPEMMNVQPIDGAPQQPAGAPFTPPVNNAMAPPPLAPQTSPTLLRMLANATKAPPVKVKAA